MSLTARQLLLAGMIAASFGLAACSSGGSGGQSAMTPPAPAPPPAPTPVNYNTAEYRNQPSLAQINVLPAYDEGAQGDGVIIAIIDSGIDVNNPEFAGRIHPQSADLVIASVVGAGDARPGGANLQDEDDHGTPVAGIIGAARNSTSVHGVAPEATLLIFRADDNEDDDPILYGEAISEGVDRAASLGAGVINMSFGSDEPGSRDDFADLLTFTKASDMVAVLAAGNDGDDDPDGSALGALDVAGAPAAIIAGAVNASNQIAGFSDRAGEGAEIYLVAPGVSIRGLSIDPPFGQTTRAFSGTSASTPHISGAAALLRSLWPTLSAEDIVDILLTSATDLGDPGADPIYGRGLLNVGAAVSPIGGVSTSSIDGGDVDVSVMGASLSGVFGDALANLAEIVVFDAYHRDFRSTLGGAVSQTAPDAFHIERNFNPFDQHSYASKALGAGWAMQMRLTARDQTARSLTNHQIAFSGADNSANDNDNARADLTEQTLALASTGAIAQNIALTTSLGFAPAAVDRMTINARNTPFLSANAFNDAYLPGSSKAMTAQMRMTLSPRISFDVLLAHGDDRPHNDALYADEHDIFYSASVEPEATVTLMRAGANFAFDHASLRIEQGYRRDNGAVLGARFSDGQRNHAATLYTAVEAVWAPTPHWQVQTRLAAGLTSANTYGFDAFTQEAPTLTSTQMSLALQRRGVFSTHDSLWLGVSQPLQIEAGALQLLLPTGYDRARDEIIFTPVRASLAPSGRRLDYEAGYRLFSNDFGALDVNIIHQTYGGFGIPADTTALIRSRFAF